MLPQHSEEKCAKCGENNPTTLRMCRMCSSLLPWVETQRATQAQQSADTAQPRTVKKTLSSVHQNQKVSGYAFSPLAKIAGVAVSALLLLSVVFFAFRPTSKPIERDIGMLDLTDKRVKTTTSMIIQSMPHIIELIDENPRASKITVVSHEDRQGKSSILSFNYALSYVPKGESIDVNTTISTKGRSVNSKLHLKTVPVKELPKFLKSFQDAANRDILAGGFVKPNKNSNRTRLR